MRALCRIHFTLNRFTPPERIYCTGPFPESCRVAAVALFEDVALDTVVMVVALRNRSIGNFSCIHVYFLIDKPMFGYLWLLQEGLIWCAPLFDTLLPKVSVMDITAW